MNTLSVFKSMQLKTLCALLVSSVVLVGCGSGSNKRENTPSSSSVSSAVSSVAVSSAAVSSAAVSSESSAVSSAESSAASSTPSTDLSFGFADGIEGWYVNGDGTNLLLEHDADADALRMTPIAWTDTDNWKRQARINIDPAINMEGATVTMVINVPESYITDAGLVLQIIIQGDPAYGDSWTPVTGLISGDNTVVWSPDAEDGTADITSLGIQLSNPPTDEMILDPILIKSILIEFAEGSGSSESSASSEASVSSESSASSAPANQLSLPVDTLTGWSNDGTPATFALNSGVAIIPDWTAAELTAMYILDAPRDFTGATVTYVVSVPQAYITDGGMALQPFSQQNSGAYDGTWINEVPGGWNPTSGLVAGDNTIIHGPFATPPADIQRVGLKLQRQTKADGVTGDVIIRSITVTFPE